MEPNPAIAVVTSSGVLVRKVVIGILYNQQLFQFGGLQKQPLHIEFLLNRRCFNAFQTLSRKIWGIHPKGKTFAGQISWQNVFGCWSCRTRGAKPNGFGSSASLHSLTFFGRKIVNHSIVGKSLLTHTPLLHPSRRRQPLLSPLQSRQFLYLRFPFPGLLQTSPDLHRGM